MYREREISDTKLVIVIQMIKYFFTNQTDQKKNEIYSLPQIIARTQRDEPLPAICL